MRDYLNELGISSHELLTRDQVHDRLRSMKSGFYVYVLWRTDRQTPEPFYVGKGRRRRVTAHLCPSGRHGNPIKTRIIAKMANNGLSPLFHFVAIELSEINAHQVEMAVISKIGRLDRGSGPLANLTDGGEGMAGYIAPTGAAHHRSRSVIIDGQTYVSCRDAAKHLGLREGQVYHRLISGWPNYSRPGDEPRQPPPGKARGAQSGRARAVYAGGSRYDTLTAAANALGVYPSAVHKRIKAGWDGYYFEDTGQMPRTRASQYSKEHMSSMLTNLTNKAKPVMAYGIRYRTIRDAAKALGCRTSTIRRKCDNHLILDFIFVT